MPKNKLQRFAELRTFSNVHEFLFDERENNFKLKGKWNNEYFKNENPIVLEVGCGKGEYSIGLAEKYPNKNFIGIDIKGARIWKASKNAQEKNLQNVSFLRTQIEFIENCFVKDEVSEIWITFPDPQPNKEKKRLTHSIFLNRYKNILKPNGIIHLKTDSAELYEFTLEVLQTPSPPPSPPFRGSETRPTLVYSTADLYSESNSLSEGEGWGEATAIKTHYEKLFTAQGKKITYLKFHF